MQCGHRELAWLFLEPDTGLDHSPGILLSCFKQRTSAEEAAMAASTRAAI